MLKHMYKNTNPWVNMQKCPIYNFNHSNTLLKKKKEALTLGRKDGKKSGSTPGDLAHGLWQDSQGPDY